ncbi:inositol monophosphatase family protein [Branchiibius sp. NY16-3462-2]|uniref:inositol monophosphatase family protein n=1 Tax=Branchiibius sp. NY16-3462-2 TaxID=1807500 RepID=UPI000792C88A|nr:inositol monophosphatase family protein [Branchiibius sp. NY16-3462-2]KYH44149.1 inositol monophosphatase [Branchiibius sp. NY16-3462-2]
MGEDLSLPALGTLETICRELAVQAGELIVRERPEHLAVADTKSSATDVVTIMDRRSEQLLQEQLRARRPEDGILGEEGASVEGTSGITWIVDPIDGTVNYLYDIPAYAVSVAACVGDPRGEWESVAGAVFNPVSGELFHARRGGGAFLRSTGADPSVTALFVSGEQDLGQALTGTGFGYDAAKRAQQAQILTRVLPQVRDIRRAGSAALDLCAVAAGRLDVYYESGLNAWDRAAGQLIVTEAGGVVRGAGAQPSRDLTLAGPAVLVEALHDVLQSDPH